MTIKERYSKLIVKTGDYDEACNLLKEECLKEGLYNGFIDYILKEYYEHTDYANSFLDVLIEQDEYQLFKRYWKVRVSEDIRYMWESIDYYKNEKDKKFTTKDFLSYDRKILDENQDKYPAMQDSWLNFVWQWYNTLDSIDNFIVQMQKINATEEIVRAEVMKESIYNLKKPKAKKTTDKRKMSELLFWELIADAREETEGDSEFIERLKDKLESMSTTEIKKFQKILLEKSNELQHWDIWALAYIVRRGCGDDAFDYFKAWVISKGEESFEDVKSMNIKKFKTLFTEDPQLEDFMYVAQEAYANKKYEEMPLPRVRVKELEGKKWEEESICKSYPELCALFDY